ncbi:MAG: LysM peptidoglycan-binding domain-containing protein [Puniceicoccales bacterium]|jgi:LysM repeat protein|nr:LysM peptidoglycan-binding domain-containing protein [Puniceicoccales bacterium]
MGRNYTWVLFLVGTVRVGILGGITHAQEDSKAKSPTEEIYFIDRKVNRVEAEYEKVRQTSEILRQKMTQMETQYHTLAQEVTENLDQLRAKYLELGQRMQKAYEEYQEKLLSEVNLKVQDLAQQMQKGFDQLSETIRKVEGNAFQAVEGAKKVMGQNHPLFSDNYPHQGVVYTLQKGDVLSTVARKLNSTVEYIRNANHLENPNILQPGQVIFVPQKQGNLPKE